MVRLLKQNKLKLNPEKTEVNAGWKDIPEGLNPLVLDGVSRAG